MDGWKMFCFHYVLKNKPLLTRWQQKWNIYYRNRLVQKPFKTVPIYVWQYKWPNLNPLSRWATLYFNQVVLMYLYKFFNYQELLTKYKKPTSLNLSGTYQGEPGIWPPSCIKPLQPTIHIPMCNKIKKAFSFQTKSLA